MTMQDTQAVQGNARIAVLGFELTLLAADYFGLVFPGGQVSIY